MLYDRPYMREPRPGGGTSALVWLICAIVAAYILECVFVLVLHSGAAFEWLLGLSVSSLRAGHVWTLLTYSFLHSPQNLLHIVCNVLALYFLGRELLPLLGSRRFLGMYFSGVVLGGLTWSAVNWHAGAGMVIGASAGVMALLVVFACFYPDREVTFLLFFVLPVTIKPKYLAFGCLALDLFGCCFYELMGNPSPFGFAHSAHLGGMAAGYLYYRFVHSATWLDKLGRKPAIELPHWLKRAAPAVAQPSFRVNLGNRGDLRAEVDRILDKINSKGFGSLTPEEKRLLDEAKDSLSRR